MMVRPLSETRPARIKTAACEREQWPILERARAKPMRFRGLIILMLNGYGWSSTLALALWWGCFLSLAGEKLTGHFGRHLQIALLDGNRVQEASWPLTLHRAAGQ
jgi:hypothetical protein